ncbi:MAG: hypothetical protein V3W34_07345 [Phycisphaerae bacterium]
MSKRKKILYGGILLLGALALLLDRAVSSDSSAPASAMAQSPGRLADLVAAAAFGPTVSVQAAPFPDAARATVGPAFQPAKRQAGKPVPHTRDLFALSHVVTEAMFGAGGENNSLAAGLRGRRVTTAEAFEQSHRLTAVMTSRDATFAIVDEQWLRVGDRLDNCELVKIAGTAATFRCPGGEAVLSVIETSKMGGLSEPQAPARGLPTHSERPKDSKD